MATEGYYNHYDDPDEYWDDEPLVPQRPHAARPVSASPTVAPKLAPTITKSTSPRIARPSQWPTYLRLRFVSDHLSPQWNSTEGAYRSELRSVRSGVVTLLPVR